MQQAIVKDSKQSRRGFLSARLTGAVLLFAAVTFASGCQSFRCNGGFGPDIVIPAKPTAVEQTALANEQLGEARSIADEEFRNEELNKAIVAFDQVIKRFPQDRIYTPAAWLIKSEIFREMERNKCATSAYHETIKRYPDIADVHANALLGMGQTLEARGKIRESKEYYSQVIDLYGDSSNQTIQAVVRRARLNYDNIR